GRRRLLDAPFFFCYVGPRPLRSFPTRRSSDLVLDLVRGQVGQLDAPPEGGVVDGQRHLAVRLEQLVDQLGVAVEERVGDVGALEDRKSTRLNSSHVKISYAVFCMTQTNS